MRFIKFWTLLIILQLSWKLSYSLLIVTWDFPLAIQAGWETLLGRGNAIDIIENGCGVCELGKCSDSVGFGGHPDEDGETTLDAMIMNGVTMDVGGIASLRHVKNAISVARRVLENTEHSLIAGDLATEFAIKMGFLNESLQTKDSLNKWQQWKNGNCQPNFWKNVKPDPKAHCGPYQLINSTAKAPKVTRKKVDADNHDTIGMVAIDLQGKIAAGTSTNGLKHKIPGRMGDSPIPGSGAYADQEVGAAAATGDGDIMMRFSPSFLAVELMRQGHSPTAAAETAIARISKHYPNFSGALIALNKDYEYGAACYGLKSFPYYTASVKDGGSIFHNISCA